MGSKIKYNKMVAYVYHHKEDQTNFAVEYTHLCSAACRHRPAGAGPKLLEFELGKKTQTKKKQCWDWKINRSMLLFEMPRSDSALFQLWGAEEDLRDGAAVWERGGKKKSSIRSSSKTLYQIGCRGSILFTWADRIYSNAYAALASDRRGIILAVRREPQKKIL